MSIKKWFALAVGGAFMASGAMAQDGIATQIEEAFKAGTLQGNLGVFYMNLDEEGADEQELMSGFVEMGFVTGEYEGLQLGIDVLGIGEIYSNDDTEFEDFYNNDNLDAAVRELYLKYGFMESSVVVGRHAPMTPPILTADSYRGITLNLGEWKEQGVGVTASVFDRAIGDVDWYDGISDWADADEMYSGASDYVYSVMANFEVMDGMVDVTPYIVHQGDFATVYGAQGAMDYEVEGGRIGGTVDYYYIDEGSDWEDDDSDAWKLYLEGEMEGFTAGLGYFAYSDESNQLNGEGWIGDLELVDDTIADLYGVSFMQDDAELWWIDLGYKWEGLRLAGQYGDYEADGDIEAEQWMVKASYDVTKQMEATVKYVDAEYEIGGPSQDVSLWQVYGVYSF